jgi:hypothetical protein
MFKRRKYAQGRPDPRPWGLRRRGPTAAVSTRPAIHPDLMASAMMMGGWISWELAHFVSEVVSPEIDW